MLGEQFAELAQAKAPAGDLAELARGDQLRVDLRRCALLLQRCSIVANREEYVSFKEVDSAMVSWWGRKSLAVKRDDADSGANTDVPPRASNSSR